MTEVLWISPNLNHYKARFLNRLTENGRIKLTVLAGAHVEELGHSRNESEEKFDRIEVKATKKNFQTSPTVYVHIVQLLIHKNFDMVLMPVEKKHALVIFFLFIAKFFFRYELISYNHLQTKGFPGSLVLDRMVTRLLFYMYDRVVFYSRETMDWAVKSRLVGAKKAFFANNTLDTGEIWRHYNFEINSSDEKVILFIGRLIANKRLDLLFKYYEQLKKNIPDLRLIIIGDGPEVMKVKSMAEKDESISWHGAIVDEALIAKYMLSAHLVFVPGASGLSIVHAFCYGKPYVTISSDNHGPEFVYVKDNENGLILDGDIEKDCKRVEAFLFNPKLYYRSCSDAFLKAQELTIEKWCEQIERALYLKI